MKQKISYPSIFFMMACLFATGAKADTEREYGTHEHGAGQLNVALDGKTLDIEVIAPAFDIVGFGHKAESEADKATLAKATKTLQDTSAMFSIPKTADCQAKPVTVKQVWEQEDDDDLSASGKKAEGHEDHKKGHHEEEHEGHSEFKITYQYTCAAPGKVTGLETHYFTLFQNAKTLKTSILSTKGQKGSVLDSKNTKILF